MSEVGLAAHPSKHLESAAVGEAQVQQNKGRNGKLEAVRVRSFAGKVVEGRGPVRNHMQRVAAAEALQRTTNEQDIGRISANEQNRVCFPCGTAQVH